MAHKKRILFICKERNESYGPSLGLINSCKFIVNELVQKGLEAKAIAVIDNNDIDREVTSYNPTHVFIEALWVIPSKLPILFKLHPNVKWYVRIHSKIPFLAYEGMAINWLRQYAELAKVNKNFNIAANNLDIGESLERTYDIPVSYFPNIYHPSDYGFDPKPYKRAHKVINIGCFGAIRPLKNQLYQALAAIAFAEDHNLTLRFHINDDRVETKGEPVLHNIQAAFNNTKHELIGHPWLEHRDFIELVRDMDLGLQVSFSETFNIVAADFVWNNIPLVGSDEISWLSPLFQAKPTEIESILKKLYTAYEGGIIDVHRVNLVNLNEYNKQSSHTWLSSL
jgi:hypothetical protein